MVTHFSLSVCAEAGGIITLWAVAIITRNNNIFLYKKTCGYYKLQLMRDVDFSITNVYRGKLHWAPGFMYKYRLFWSGSSIVWISFKEYL